MIKKKWYSRREIINDIRNVRTAIISEVMPKTIVDGDIRKIAQLEEKLLELESLGYPEIIEDEVYFRFKLYKLLRKLKIDCYHVRAGKWIIWKSDKEERRWLNDKIDA